MPILTTRLSSPTFFKSIDIAMFVVVVVNVVVVNLCIPLLIRLLYTPY